MATLDKWEKQHVEGIESCENEVKKTFLNAILEATTIAIIVSRVFKSDRVFRFKDYPIVKDRTDKLFAEFEQNINNVITTGIATQWALANTKNDTLCRSIFSDKTIEKMSARLRQRYFSENNAAKNVFITRETDGRTLSDRVWKYTNQFKEEIELALDIGIRDGLSADKMSRQLRQYLNEPNRLFRRVRDEHGNLVLSQAAKAYHPGQGVYRSSYKNARRLAATETNMAYRTSDYLRWQQLDFIVGIEIRLSNNHTLNGEPFFDICDILKGRYPKDFKFTGWHPLCRCYAVPILKTEEEMAEDNRRILDGKEPIQGSINEVRDVPKEFKQWLKDNNNRIARAKNLPYFIKDNNKYIKRITVSIPSNLNDIIQLAEKAGLGYLRVSTLPRALTENEIIKRVGGGDLTTGSCSSLAFAYAGNRCGFDVLDFKGGISQNFFSRTGNIMFIAEKVGGTVTKHTNDFKKAKDLLKTTEKDKEYYFTCGSHAAIVKRTETGFEYLELQSAYNNGFKPLTEDVLKRRFVAKKSHTLYGTKCETKDCIIDIDLLRKDSGFRKLLGYINTADNEQKKGATGTTK